MYEHLDNFKEKIINSRKMTEDAQFRKDKEKRDFWEKENVAYRAQYGLLWKQTLNALSPQMRNETLDALDRVDQIGRMRNDYRLKPYLVEGRRIVEQYKTRSAGTWSTRDIVFDVLPDLFRAVDETQPASKYRFVTDGRLGRIGHLQGFLKHFSDSPPTNPLSALDDREKHPYYNSEKKTELEFFRHIA